MALPKARRLRQAKTFAAVHQGGRRRRSPHLAVVVLSRPGVATPDAPPFPSRFGITVSKKVSKRAVVRNRLKRQVSAAIQALLPQIRENYWIVVVARSGAVDGTYRQFLQELKNLFTDLEVLHGDS